MPLVNPSQRRVRFLVTGNAQYVDDIVEMKRSNRSRSTAIQNIYYVYVLESLSIEMV